MAPRRTATLIQPADIKIGSSTQKDATTLVRFVKQEKAAAMPLLDRVLAQGSVSMQREAVRQMARLDAPRAERAVMAALGQAGPANEEEHEQIRSWLLLVGTVSAVETFFAEGGVASQGDPPEAFFSYVTVQIPRLDEAGVEALFERTGVVPRWVPLRSPKARALARSLLAHPARAVQQHGAEALLKTDGLACVETLAQHGLMPPLETLLSLCDWNNPASQFTALSRFAADAAQRAQILDGLRGVLDPRWLPVLGPYLDEPRVFDLLAKNRHPDALARLRAIADSSTFDHATQRACYTLGHAPDPLATPILLRWLADPVGRQASPMLLTALGECGRADAIPVIERLSANEPGRAVFYGSAIDSIRRRGA